MKINEIIIEDFDQYAIHDLSNPQRHKEIAAVKNAEQIANIIKTNCSQMLSAYQKTGIVLLRGVAGFPMLDPIITNIRPDRKPFEMPTRSHKKLHLAYRAAGLTATRTNSIFCTTRRGIASTWGRTYIVFVKDGWSGTVFKKFKEDYSFYELQRIGDQKNSNIAQLAHDIKQLGPIVVTPQNLPNILNERYEDILITGESYIGFRIFLNKLTNKGNRVFKLLNLKPTNL